MNCTNINTLNETEKKYLRYFVLLPKESYPVTSIFDFFDIEAYQEVECFDTLYDLSKKNWLIRKGNCYALNKEKQSIIVKNNTPTSDNCHDLIISFINKLYNKEINELDRLLTYLACSESISDWFTETDENLSILNNNIFVTYRRLDDYKKSIHYNLKNLQYEEQTLQRNDPKLADSYYDIAISYAKTGDLNKCLEYNLKALKIREKILDSNHQDLSNSYKITSIAYSQLKNHKKSLEYALKSLNITESQNSRNYYDLGTSYYNVALTCFTLNYYEDAVYYIEKAVMAHGKILPREHPDMQEIMSTQRDFMFFYRLSKILPKVIKWLIRLVLVGLVALIIYLIIY